MENCRKYLKNFLEDDPKSFEFLHKKSIDFLNLKLSKISIVLNDDKYEKPSIYVLVFIEISYKNKEIWYYKDVFDETGEGVDDFMLDPEDISQFF